MSEKDPQKINPLIPLNVLNIGHAPERNNTIGEKGVRKWIYADTANGFFTKNREFFGYFLIALYFVVPFITIGGNPLLKFDIPNRRFNIFGQFFLPSDIFLLTLFLLIGVIGLFLFSAIFGRLWCGWGCPQTVYLEGVFRRIERLIEGSPAQRKKLDTGIRDDGYWTKKVFKHALFMLISALLALSFASYFVGPDDAYRLLKEPTLHPVVLVIVLSLTIAVYFDFAWFREQFCTFLCPYARFQSVMIDEQSMIIAYDPVRGEPRGALRPNTLTGDCIDCKRCVQVCPTGIDIRDGLQLECVNCTACIDACNSVMEKINRPLNLIRYDSLAGIAHIPRKVFRPRIAIYLSLLLVLAVMFGWKLSSRELIKFSIVRPAGIPYIIQEDGTVRNRFEIHLVNADAKSRTINIQLDRKNFLQMDFLIPGQPFTLTSGQRITAEAFVMWHSNQIHAPATPIQFNLLEENQILSAFNVKFLGPVADEKR